MRLQSKQNFSIMDVLPPQHEGCDKEEELHSNQDKKKQDILLVPMPTHTLPLHYNLHLDFTNAANKIIRGSMTIELEVLENSTDNEILFHVGPNVIIDRIRLRKEGKRVYPKTLRIEESKMLARIVLKESLKNGVYLLEIDYNTTICNEENGTQCDYELDPLNNSLVSAFTTKFEPTHARSFLPCWDDPGIKATFNITVMHLSKYVVLSNMPPNGSKKTPEGKTTTSFEQTPPMSAYSLAFAMGQLVPLEMRTGRNLPLTLWIHPEDLLSAQFAANFSPVVFDRLESELELLYPMPKIDLVAARNFPVDGTKNWGLIIFDKNSVLLDAKLEDSPNMTVDRLYHEYNIKKIITSQIAHQCK
ncbi:peptidase family M1 [Dictyocaulus viviparus]|uniref:Peptidase family M1 n=1 Tax=Dictyocaulus viviparus TaxID=29172 RepID=A0A0D8XL66_DICVI|nr:peptidase family M1 [Dictyocaulus viviparus]